MKPSTPFSSLSGPETRASADTNHEKVLRGQIGFTLVEVLVVVALLAIIAALAAPSFASLIGRTRTQSLVSSLEASVYQARSEAVRRGAAVQMSPIRCAGEPDTAVPRWGCGWQIVQVAGGAVIRTVDLTGQDVVLLSGGQGNLSFTARGAVAFAGIHVSNAHSCRKVNVSIAGRITVAAPPPESKPDSQTGSYCP
jgi:type IV fimbrial biogenesis protein FimT